MSAEPRSLAPLLPALASALIGLAACAGLDRGDDAAEGGEAIGRGSSSGQVEPIGGGGPNGGATTVEPASGGAVSSEGAGGSGGSAVDSGGTGGSPSLGDCCDEGLSGGCSDAAVEACVCSSDPYCCQTAWDAFCVDLGASECGAPCADGQGGAGGEGEGGGDGGGCDDPPSDCVDCVLSQCDLACILQGNCDPGVGVAVVQCLLFTCGQECLGWDPGDCGCDPPAQACCSAQIDPGCGDATIETCVCQHDDYCCTTAWDDVCVDELEQFGCGSCTP